MQAPQEAALQADRVKRVQLVCHNMMTLMIFIGVQMTLRMESAGYYYPSSDEIGLKPSLQTRSSVAELDSIHREDECAHSHAQMDQYNRAHEPIAWRVYELAELILARLV